MKQRKTYSGHILELDKNEVFVFGANTMGWHGKGAAGVTMGVQRSIKEIRMLSDGTKGKWAIKGQIGLMQGLQAWSYGLVTIEKPGNKRSLDAETIVNNIAELYGIANTHNEKQFLIAYDGQDPMVISLNGYSRIELAEFFMKAGPIPENIVFEKAFNSLVNSGLQ